jgi:hypothetical protein
MQMNKLRENLKYAGLWGAALLCSLVATSKYYSIYNLCQGSSAGVALGLTLFVVPVAATIFMFLGTAANYFFRKSILLSRAWLILLIRVIVILIGSSLLFVYLVSTVKPYQVDIFGKKNPPFSSECPEWLNGT